jgi:transposase
VLVPVEITSTPAPASTVVAQPRLSLAREPAKVGIIEIELGGWRVRVDRDVDTEALQRVLELLRR